MRFSSSSTRATAGRAAIAVAVLGGLLAMFLRWYFVTHAQVLQPLYRDSEWGDAGQYYRYAWNLFHHGLFSSAVPGSADPISDGFRDPAYPALLALGMAVTDNYDHWYRAVILTQVILGAVTVTCAVLSIRDTMPTWLLAVAAVTMAAWPHLVSIPAYVLSENLTAPLCAITALALREAAARRSMSYIVVAGVVMALAALSNAVLGPIAIMLACAFAWKRTMPRHQLLVLAAVSTLPLIAWGIRNAHLTAPLSPAIRVEMNLVQGSWPTYHAAAQLASVEDPVGVQTIEAMNLEMATLHINRVEGLKGIAERMSHAPGTYLVWYLSKPALLWGWEIGLGAGDIYMYPTQNSPFIVNPIFKAIEAVTFVLNGVLALTGLAGLVVVALRRNPPAAMITFAVTAACATLVYGVLQSDARYSTPFRPAEIALACMALCEAAGYFRERVATARTPS